MYEKLLSIISEYDALKEQLYDPANYTDHTLLKTINKKIKSIEELYNLAIDFVRHTNIARDAQGIIDTENDPELIDMAKEELTQSKWLLCNIEEAVKLAIVPKDPNDEKDAYLEIRPAAGGDEAGLFAAELLKCYLLHAQIQWRKTEMVENQLSDIWGVKLVIVKIVGERVYSKLKFESGVHRVQRIPDTESNGRVHTSTITVAIMPEAEEVDVTINPADIVMDTYAASSAGGQNANKNQTGVRLHHLPTGLIVTIGDSKSQLHNKDKAYAVLRSRLYQIEQAKITAAEKDLRGGQIGSGGRSEKIRTYNYPQDRITDHRIHQSRSNLPQVMMGNIDMIIDALHLAEQNNTLGTGDDDD